jgi:methionyl-tRNA synthetase
MSKKILVTSALPYVNNIPHLGNLIGSVLSADVFARFARLDNNEVLFVLGTDEYGTTAVAKAKEEGLTPRELVDKYFKIHKNIYDWFNTSYDCLGRTTSEENKKITQDIFLHLYEKGLIVEKEIEQLYNENNKEFLSDRFVIGTCPHCKYEGARGDQCDSCGKLLDQKDLINPKSVSDGSTPIMKKTKHLYVDLPKLQPKLAEFFENKKDNWSAQAVSITKQWLKKGLEQRSITRDLSWGIEVPLDGWRDKVFYSWFDAPIGYIGITAEKLGEKWEDWWKNKDVTLYQFMGKDNVPFHSIMFPAYLIGSEDNYITVDHLDATAYLNYEDSKFSKSLGTGVFGDDAMNSGIESDLWRYYLFRMRPEDGESEFSWEDFEAKINNELVSNFGNFINRVVSLNKKYFDGIKQKKKSNELSKLINPHVKEYKELMYKSRERNALLKANEISSVANKYLQDKEPWIIVKEDKESAGEIISECIDIFKTLSVLYYPFVPTACEKVANSVGYDIKKGFSEIDVEVKEGTKIKEIGILFNKVENKKVEELRKKFAPKEKSVEVKVEKEINDLGINVSYAVFNNIKVKKKHTGLAKLIDKEIKKIDINSKMIRNHEKGFEDIYTSIGMTGKNSVKNLIELVEKNNKLPQINTFVDCYNLNSLKYGVVSGAHDIDNIKGKVVFKLNPYDAKYIPLGANKMVDVKKGDLCIFDDEGIISTMEKQCDRTKSDIGSTSIMLYFQGNKDIDKKYVKNAMEETCELVKKYCGGTYKIIN